jgi:hypothetical protein
VVTRHYLLYEREQKFVHFSIAVCAVVFRHACTLQLYRPLRFGCHYRSSEHLSNDGYSTYKAHNFERSLPYNAADEIWLSMDSSQNRLISV